MIKNKIIKKIKKSKIPYLILLNILIQKIKKQKLKKMKTQSVETAQNLSIKNYDFNCDQLLYNNFTNMKKFVINLKKDVIKKKFMQYKLYQNKMFNVNFIEGVDGYEKFNNIYRNNYKYKIKYYGQINSVGALGLIETYRRLLNDNINEDRILILEDDVYFYKDFNIKIIDNLINNYDIIYLGANQEKWNNVKLIDNKYYIIDTYKYGNITYGTYGFIINNKAIKSILNLIGTKNNKFSKFQLTIDTDIYANLICKKVLSACCLYPNFVIPEIRESNNMGKRSFKDFTNRRWKLNDYKYMNMFNKKYILKFVFIIPSYNNINYCEKNITSIIKQNYFNWSIIYIDDNSSDNTGNIVKSLLDKYNISDRCTLIQNKINYGQAFNRYIAYHMCDDNDMCILLDGDDWLYNNTVLSYLSKFITKYNLDMTYRNFKYFSNGKIVNGYSLNDYSINTIKHKKYRNDKWRAGHLRVIRAKLLKNIDIFDLMDNNYNFIQCCTDRVESYGCLEQSNGKHKMCDIDLMVYNRDNSIKYNTSEYHNISNRYRKIIEEKIKNQKYYNYKKSMFETLCIINIENLSFKQNLNKYLHELSNDADLFLLKNSDYDRYKKKFNKYKHIIYLNDYIDLSYNASLKNYNYCNHFKRDNILISILIPCYNCASFIKTTLNSLELQTNNLFEVILVNDGSTDNTNDIIINLLNKKNYKFKIRYYNKKKNIGYAHTLGECISLSNTKYFCTLDSDDSLEKNTIEIIYENINKHPNIGFFYTNFNYCDKNLNIICKGFCKKIPDHKTALECNYISQLRIFKKECYYLTTGYIDTNLFKNGAEDKDIYFKMEEKCKMKFINKCLYNYRYNINSLTKKTNGTKICKKLFKLAKKKAIKRRSDNQIIKNFLNLTKTISKQPTKN
jgi:glycosyltransferase involved in cell wall biosynthesis